MKITKIALERLGKKKLIELFLVQQEQIARQQKQIEILEKRIRQLEKDSSTSSKPPSSDIKKQNKKNQSLRKKTGLKPGGQKGHKGVTREQINNPDKEVRCEPNHCECCGCSLKNQEGKIIEKRQERDIPPITVFITEYQKIEKQCSCGHINKGEFPEGINAPVQIGPNAKSFMVYLNIKQLLPFDRLKQVALDLFSFEIGTGTIDNILESAYGKSQKIQNEIMHFLRNSRWVGGDETGLRFEGKRGWLWTWQNNAASYYAAEQGRGYAEVMKHFGEDYEGSLVHDCWPAQNNTKAKKGHQLCHPHLQRDLEYLIKEYRSKWAYDICSLLSASQKARDQIWQDDFDISLRNRIIKEYKDVLEKLNQRELKKDEEITLQKRFRKHKEKIFFFMNDPEIPFHNNGSEQAVRAAKVKQKISGCFRSKNGADRYACLLSFVETCRKQGLNVLKSIGKLLQNDFSFGF